MSYVYNVGGKAVTLHERKDLVAVRYREPAPHSMRAEFANKAGADFDRRVEVPEEKYTLLSAQAAGEHVLQPVRMAAAAATSGVERTTPVFRHGSMNVIATDRVLFGLSDSNQPVDHVLGGVRKLDVQSRGNGEYMVQLAQDVDPLTVAKQLAEVPGVRYAEPDFVNIGERPGGGKVATVEALSAAELEAGLQAQQYAMTITRARDVWQILTGAPSVRIAVLDEGIDVRHKDLRRSVVASYDAVDGDEFQDPNPWDGHGTACAGLAAAFPDKDGVRGVGGGCSIFAVRIAASAMPNGPWAWSNDRAGTAIEWSWRRGADVLSNSWGGGAPSNRIAEAFQRALRMGRGGKGCVVVVAAGNDSGAVTFPGTLPGVLTVSASNERDEFKTKSSSDGETFWGSNFGREVGIAAPGVHNLTTDITGAAGYDGSGYYGRFNGTSSATPLVAGAAAMVLSAYPHLTGAQVQELLCGTADKVGQMKYVDGRNDQFGFGRLNVLKAIQIGGGLGSGSEAVEEAA